MNGKFVPDQTGTECSSAEEVRAKAVEAAGAMIEEQGFALWDTGSWYMFVCDEESNTLLKLEFSAEKLKGNIGGLPR